MDSVFFKVTLKDGESIKVDNWDIPHFYSFNHIHPEFQLTWIEKSSGLLYFGDSVYGFKEGDIFLIGPNIPHVFVDSPENGGSKTGIKAISIFFPENYAKTVFTIIEEAASIRKLLASSLFCIKAGERSSEAIAQCMKEMRDVHTDFMRVVKLMEILYRISLDYTQISLNAQPVLPETGTRIEKVYAYSTKHYAERIDIHDVAQLIGMTDPAFCRFFKKSTGKSYMQFLIEFRIAVACRYMISEDSGLADIAYRTGFGSMTNFIRQFKKIMGMTPSEYKESMSFDKNKNY